MVLFQIKIIIEYFSKHLCVTIKSLLRSKSISFRIKSAVLWFRGICLQKTADLNYSVCLVFFDECDEPV